MIDILTSKYQIDSQRVYLTGWSNGAMMTFRAVCELGNKIRAAAPYAGGFAIKKLTKDNSGGDKYPYYPNVVIDSEADYFNENVTELDWKAFDSYFTCKSDNKVPLLIMNGRDDHVVDTRGSVVYNETSGKSMGWPPIEYSAWYFASLN